MIQKSYPYWYTDDDLPIINDEENYVLYLLDN